MTALFGSSKDKQAQDASKDGADAREWLIPADARKQLQELFAKLPNTVVLDAYTDDDPKNIFNGYMTRFVDDLAALAPRIEARHHNIGGDDAVKHEVTLSPTLLINPDDYRIRFTGAPLGEEGRALIESIFLVAMRRSALSDLSSSLLAPLTEPRHARVFSSPGCPYCPGQFIHAVKCAIEKPGIVTAECVNSDEFSDLSRRYGVGSVPHTQFSDEHKGIGLMPEERFVLELVELRDAEEVLRERGQLPDEPHVDGAPGIDVKEYDMVVLGAGPAGLSAAIYAERSGMKTVVLDKAMVGGQVTVTPVVENYPGFTDIAGLKLVEVLSAHARQYATVRENEAVSEIKIGRNIEVYTPRAVYLARALVFATGAQWRKLGAPGEDRFYAKGVSHCASCDGFIYKGKKVAVVGGGNTALTDALHLKNLGVDVTLIHRRDSFRAEKALQESLAREGIPVIWDTEVLEIMGDDVVRGIRTRNVKTDEVKDIPFDGVFVAIGHVPNTELAVELGVQLEADGSIKVDRHMRTNIPRIYAAGDVTGGVRQIVTAVGSGATAALAAFEDTQNPYWKK